MKLLITGGCGFLGSNLAAHAVRSGYDVAIFDNLSRLGATQNLEWLRSMGTFLFQHGDIRNSNDVERIVREFSPDVIFHLAGQVAMTTSIANPRLDFEINVMGSHNVLEAVRKHSPSTAIFYSSTNKVYGDLEQYGYRETATRYECIDRPRGFDETTPLEFHSPYGCSKGAADQYMLDYARIFGLKTVVFRHSSMYGGRQYATYDQGWVGWFCQQAVEKETDPLATFTISGSGKQVRDVLHAEDMISLYFKGVERIDSIHGQVFNVGGGVANSLSLLELFALLEQVVGVQLDFRRLPPRESDQRVFIADSAKAERMLDWTPRVTSAAGVANMVAWARNLRNGSSRQGA